MLIISLVCHVKTDEHNLVSKHTIKQRINTAYRVQMNISLRAKLYNPKSSMAKYIIFHEHSYVKVIKRALKNLPINIWIGVCLYVCLVCLYVCP